MPSTKAIGDIGEQLAAEYLEAKGYEILERNAKYAGCEADIIYRCRVNDEGEIISHDRRNGRFRGLFSRDKKPIAQNKNSNSVIVFCEVKTRSDNTYGEPLESVTPYKIGRYVRLAEAYISSKFAVDTDIRFDVIEVDERGRINHIENAFDANDAKYSRRRI